MTTPLKVGPFGIGLAADWSQFAGLRERFSGYLEQVARQIARPGVEILNLGLVDTPGKALTAGHEFQRPAHHCAVGVGQLSGRLKKLAALLPMDSVQVS